MWLIFAFISHFWPLFLFIWSFSYLFIPTVESISIFCIKNVKLNMLYDSERRLYSRHRVSCDLIQNPPIMDKNVTYCGHPVYMACLYVLRNWFPVYNVDPGICCYKKRKKNYFPAQICALGLFRSSPKHTWPSYILFACPNAMSHATNEVWLSPPPNLLLLRLLFVTPVTNLHIAMAGCKLSAVPCFLGSVC